MNQCMTCKHWTPPDKDQIDWERKLGETPHERGACERITMIGDSARPVPITDLAHVEDGSGYRAVLHTRPDFGCVLHVELQLGLQERIDRARAWRDWYSACLGAAGTNAAEQAFCRLKLSDAQVRLDDLVKQATNR